LIREKYIIIIIGTLKVIFYTHVLTVLQSFFFLN